MAAYEISVNETTRPAPARLVLVDRQSLFALRIMPALPDDFLITNHVNITLMRIMEGIYSAAIDRINVLDGYVSPCSLWLREDYLQKLVEAIAVGDRREFYADHGSKRVVIDIFRKRQQLSDDESQQVVWKMKEYVRRAIGHGVRSYSVGYQRALEEAIGPLMMSPHSVVYPYTVPLESVLDKTP